MRIHVYQSIREAAVGEQLNCAREVGNLSDTFAVTVVKVNDTVGHFPRKVSSICSIFLQNGGTISCEVTGSRHYSNNLAQGGLEVPCILKFVGSSKDITKAKKLMDTSLLNQTCSSVKTVSQSDIKSKDTPKRS